MGIWGILFYGPVRGYPFDNFTLKKNNLARLSRSIYIVLCSTKIITQIDWSIS